jgi:hypothetical protein
MGERESRRDGKRDRMSRPRTRGRLQRHNPEQSMKGRIVWSVRTQGLGEKKKRTYRQKEHSISKKYLATVRA